MSERQSRNWPFALLRTAAANGPELFKKAYTCTVTQNKLSFSAKKHTGGVCLAAPIWFWNALKDV